MNHQPARVLIVDDDRIVADSIAECLRDDGFDTLITLTAEDALEAIESAASSQNQANFATAIIDMSLPGMSGLELIQSLRERKHDVIPLAITGYGTIASAVETVRNGAIDYLIKPLVDEELMIAIQRAIRQHTLVAENNTLRNQLENRFGLDNIVGNDPRMLRMFDIVHAVAPTKTTILMSGESGTGKSMIARAIHRASTRADEPFIELACGSIPETLLESELFGHVEGAFTGANADKVGRFAAANGGTIFLDEINSASPAMQLKLLRVLQEKMFEPVGSTETIEVDVRVILASNQPLEDLVADGSFRQDLYYRINVVMIQLPPLRERTTDIVTLANHFLQHHARETNREIVGFEPSAMTALEQYHYPGNVRELENIIERAVVLTKSVRIQRADLPERVLKNSSSLLSTDRHAIQCSTDNWQPIALTDALREPEKQIILAALEANDWNRQKTSDDLQINRTTLYKKIKQYGLESYGCAE